MGPRGPGPTPPIPVKTWDNTKMRMKAAAKTTAHQPRGLLGKMVIRVLSTSSCTRMLAYEFIAY
jgi:hypothetical protein